MCDGNSRALRPTDGTPRSGVFSSRVAIALLTACLGLSACQRNPSPGAEAPATTAKSGADEPGGAKGEVDAKGDASEKAEGVILTTEQVQKLGVETYTAKTTEHSEEALGYGVIVSHDVIAQSAAELVTAKATERLSRSALNRVQKLSGTPGALSADVVEAAAQKAQIDAAALTLTTQKLSSTLGMRPPWKPDDKDPILRDLASGKIKLVRVTFPLGTLSGGTPTSLRATRIGISKPQAGWTLQTIWDAPSDASVPGRSFFALLRRGDAGEGERLQVWAPVGEYESGVEVPAASAIMSDGKYWCYVERKPGAFSRVEIDTSKPTAEGYFITAGVAAGDKVVISAAGQLLAKETGSSAESD